MAVDARATASEVGQLVAELDLSGVWAVDPASGREGPADLIVRDGRVESLKFETYHAHLSSLRGYSKVWSRK